MSESCEYRTVESCIEQLETALFKSDSDIVHFLRREGFISKVVHGEVLNPRLLNDHQKAGELVTGIGNEVKLSAQKYHTLLNHLRQSGKYYKSIVNILDKEYSRQQQIGKYNNYTFRRESGMSHCSVPSCL